jgi:hypothetical protein
LAKIVKKRGRKKKEEIKEEIPAEAGDVEEVVDADDEEDSERTDESAEVDLGDSDIELDGDDGVDLEEVDVSKEDPSSAAQLLAIRRALEDREDQKKMSRELDYLDFDD